MVTNLLVWLLFFALFLVGIWLLVRSIRSKNKIRRVVGIIGGVVLILLMGTVAFFGGKGLWVMYVPVGEVRDLQVQGTPEQISRGEYLAAITCIGCHGRDGQRDQPMVGGLDLGKDIPLPLGSMIASNITPAGILKERSDGELFRLLRYGYTGDGQLSVVMSNMPYRELSDEDIEAVIAYLRSLDPVESTGKRDSQMNFLGAVMVGNGMIPVSEPIHGIITSPPSGETVEYGKYVANFGDCRTCHGPDMTGTPASMLIPNGYPNPRPIVGTWTVEEFIQTMRTGVRPTGQALNMPWENASQMSDQDLTALYTYLRAEY